MRKLSVEKDLTACYAGNILQGILITKVLDKGVDVCLRKGPRLLWNAAFELGEQLQYESDYEHFDKELSDYRSRIHYEKSKDYDPFGPSSK